MPTYNASAVADTAIAFQKPITLQQGRALRDNPLAALEGDASAPANLLPTIHLGTLTTTSGTSQTLSGLVLTPYKFVRLVWNGVSHNDTINNRTFRIGTVPIISSIDAATSATFMTDIDLATGLAISFGLYSGSGITTITNASTSIQISPSGGNFDNGSVRFYGMK